MASASSRLRQLLGRILLLSIPAWLVLVSYFIFDPFWVLYHYDTFSGNLITIPNRDYVSTQMYLNTYRQRRYRSYILGNSRTLAFPVRDWIRYTGDTAAFHFDASSETLYGVWKKLAFVEAHGSGIGHVLLVFDPSLLVETHNINAHLARKDPRLTGEFPLAFQWTFIRAYLSNHFYEKYLKHKITGRYTPDMGGLLEGRRVYYDPYTNDLSLPELEEEIRRDSVGFYAQERGLGPRPAVPAVSPAVIGPEQLRQLEAIHAILRRNHTSYQVVLSPTYKQEPVNPADLTVLKRIFGAPYIHDFSGVNRFTQAAGNYYEQYHFRPVLGRQLLRLIYAPDSMASKSAN